MISLSISALGCTLLFLYFRNKISSMEKKVDVMFDLIQNHQQEQYNTQGTNHQEVEEHNIMSNDNFNNFDENIQNNVNLIPVSEDDDDSDEVSDSEDEDVSDNEELPKISLDSTENMTLEVNDIKKITVQEADKVLIDDSIQMEEVEDITDSLDEMDDDSDDEENNNEDVTEVKEVTVQKIDDDFDYSKLKVTELKALAKQKGLENYKSLKKGPLVDLLKSTE
tara:strand:- start:48 stop:716 length:669 start_codon:yes stop_codon:yes gene_type:complete